MIPGLHPKPLLAYEHFTAGVLGDPDPTFACQVPEYPMPEYGPTVWFSPMCEGCRVGAAAVMLRDPTQTFWDAATSRNWTALEAFRSRFEPDDPFRIIVERELARRTEAACRI